MRFRHKLSIVLVGLAIVPLAAAGVLVGVLLQRNQVTRVDNRLSVAAGAGAQAYRAELQVARNVAQDFALRPTVAAAFVSKNPNVNLMDGVPSGMVVVGARRGRRSAIVGRRRAAVLATRRPRRQCRPSGRR